jgi:hypothetical protein
MLTDRMYYPINHFGMVVFLGMGGGGIYYEESSQHWTMFGKKGSSATGSFKNLPIGKDMQPK